MTQSPRWLVVDPSACSAHAVAEAAEWLRQGGIVAYPTDTLYGLAADPTSDAAVDQIFDLKGRAATAALPLLAASPEQVEQFAGPLTGETKTLARTFWPGPLSLIFDAPPAVADAVHAGSGTVAVRVPSHAVARALAEAAGSLITATSANRSGETPARSAAELDWLRDDPRVFVIDGGPAPGGLPSTIADVRGPWPIMLRDGAVPWNRVLRSLNE